MSPEAEVERGKTLRLVEYLLRLASLGSKVLRDVREYEKVLWLSEIPKQTGCFTQAWGGDEEYDPDVWVEVQGYPEPQLPSPPQQCAEWTDREALRNKNDRPQLLSCINTQVQNPNYSEGSDQPEIITETENLEDHPEVQVAWDRYIEERWLPWEEGHSAWEAVHKVYSTLFAIHQEQLRLGEEYELILGLGLLDWQTPTGQRVRRHLVVANALLEFEALLGKFTVRPTTDGANLRPELDMLAVEEQPARAEEAAKSSLASAGDDPWDKDCLEGTFKGLAHSISPEGDYREGLEPVSIPVSSRPVVQHAPALILRKRSSKGLLETLRRIKAKIESGDAIPDEFADLAELPGQGASEAQAEPREEGAKFDGEVFFPKLSNEEQLRVVHKIAHVGGVLVQGPPGTGKSHTIANLICHLLATGQRILVTAKTPRALKVLEGLIPESIRPLCINLLGNGLEEKKSLESSVAGILRKNEEWTEQRASNKQSQLEEQLSELREERAGAERRLRDIRESETHVRSIAGGAYRGTAARIAEMVNRDRNAYEWFTDAAAPDESCPITESELRNLLESLRMLTPEKREELHSKWPISLFLPVPKTLADLFEREKSAADEEARMENLADGDIANQLSSVDDASVAEISGSVSVFQKEHDRLSAFPDSWARDALRDVTCGSAPLWHELRRVTEDTTASVDPLVRRADQARIDYPNEINIRTALEDVSKLKEHLKAGGKLGWGPFRPKLVRERIYVLKRIKVNGRRCLSMESLSTLADALHVRVECEELWRFWEGRCRKTEGPYALQVQTLKGFSKILSDVLTLEGTIQECRSTMRRHIPSAEPNWADERQVERLFDSCQLALARRRKHGALEKIRNFEAEIARPLAEEKSHPVTSELLNAVRSRDIRAYEQFWNVVQNLEKQRTHMGVVDEKALQLRRYAPRLIDELERTFDDSCWDSRVEKIRDAWQWAQARLWIEDFVGREDASSLDVRLRQIEDEIHATITDLASIRGWSFCFSRLEEPHRRHMEAWQQSMKRLGRGTGRHATHYRREAQQHLNQCREAVPAWVMPLHRIWDTVDPSPGMFEVIIVDEASQCGFEALPLLYLGKKILIVGDDKQISPEAVGLPRDAVYRLMRDFLPDFRYQSSFDIEGSLFDQGKLRYGTRRITLREHFRCMPEIIRFSNDLCYFDTPLIPLRQYGPDRLSSLRHVFVETGYREGSSSRAINRPEADSIAEKIAELCHDSRYEEKTMGVVVLQGEAQAGLIEQRLLDLLGAEEMDRRRLICGNPYSFQGDERDVIFLSMVAAPNERIGPFTRPADERRFNVAASRARDQMWLFHSVRREDLSSTDLRRKLLEFFEDTRPQDIAGIKKDDLERHAAQDDRSVVKPPQPFDSWFEVDVALELLRRGYFVLPQYEFAGKRIDLVVEGGRSRLAVECDGDRWHGADRYEDDMQRQRQLERCGWTFFRLRESKFYANRAKDLSRLWPLLEERGIVPQRRARFADSGAAQVAPENRDKG